MKRKGSVNFQFVQRIPADIKGRVAGLKLHIPVGAETVTVQLSTKAASVRLSLRASLPGEVKARQGEVGAFLETAWEALRQNRPVPLSHRQAVALSREVYAAWAGGRETAYSAERPSHDAKHVVLVPNDPRPEPGAWAAMLDRFEAIEGDPERELGPIVDRLLREKGVGEVDPVSRNMALNAALAAIKDALALRQRQASGDFSPDPKASRFPEWKDIAQAPAPAAGISFIDLVEGWWAEAKRVNRSVSTYESYKGTFSRLKAHQKHDDAARVRPADIVAFKDARLASGISPKTVSDTDIAGLKSVFAWAVTNLHLPSNPAEGIKVAKGKAVRVREKAFTEEEALAILAQAQGVKGNEGLNGARRWVPWLCAYTGARVGEVIQLRKEDVRRDRDRLVMRITPEAGPVKDKEVREVVLHAHLVEQGFEAFAKQSKGPYVFLGPHKDIRMAIKSARNKLVAFARAVVPDPEVAPNHGWRHLFKTRGREAGISDSVLDAMCGHAPGSIGAAYGGVTLKAQAEAMERFPRFAVG